MFWIKTIKQIKDIESTHYKMINKRINTICDYIQDKLLKEIIEADTKIIVDAFNKKEEILKKHIDEKLKNKKDK